MISTAYKIMAGMHFTMTFMLVVSGIQSWGTIWSPINLALAALNVWLGFNRLEGK